MVLCRLDRVEMRRWVTADMIEAAHSEAKKLLFHVDKDNVSVCDTALK